MLFRDISILDENFEHKEHCYVGIKNDTIDYIGTEPPQEDYGRVYAGRGRLLMSSFVNAHAHTPMMLMRGFGENMNLQDWLNNKIFPFEAKMNGTDVYYSALLGLAESVRFGITSHTDMYYFGEENAKAVLESGMKSNIGVNFMCFGDEGVKDLPTYQEVKHLFETYHNAGGGRVKIDVSIHAEYTSTEKLVRETALLCQELGLRMHIHLSETKREHEECKARRGGMTPAAYFKATGLLDNPTTAAHCVWIEGDDFDILAEKNVTVASCPVSNLKLASGVCNVPKLREKGVSVAIGTDSVSSNNSLNFIEEMKIFALVHKGFYGDPTATSPVEALKSATVNGARSQGRQDCGVLKVGNKADLIVLDTTAALHMQPVHDMAGNVVYAASGSDVALTMADGKILYKDGEYLTIDVEKALYEVKRSASRITEELKGR